MNSYEVWYRPFQKGRRYMRTQKVVAESVEAAKQIIRVITPTAQFVAVWPDDQEQRQVA